MSTPPRDETTAEARRRIAAELAAIEFALPGTVITRMMRCGNKGCRCRADPPQLHGPYLQWTRKENGKTISKMISQEQLDRYQPWLDNARQLRELVHHLETITIQTVKRTEGWGS